MGNFIFFLPNCRFLKIVYHESKRDQNASYTISESRSKLMTQVCGEWFVWGNSTAKQILSKTVFFNDDDKCIYIIKNCQAQIIIAEEEEHGRRRPNVKCSELVKATGHRRGQHGVFESFSWSRNLISHVYKPAGELDDRVGYNDSHLGQKLMRNIHNSLEPRTLECTVEPP